MKSKSTVMAASRGERAASAVREYEEAVREYEAAAERCAATLREVSIERGEDDKAVAQAAVRTLVRLLSGAEVTAAKAAGALQDLTGRVPDSRGRLVPVGSADRSSSSRGRALRDSTPRAAPTRMRTACTRHLLSIPYVA